MIFEKKAFLRLENKKKPYLWRQSWKSIPVEEASRSRAWNPHRKISGRNSMRWCYIGSLGSDSTRHKASSLVSFWGTLEAIECAQKPKCQLWLILWEVGWCLANACVKVAVLSVATHALVSGRWENNPRPHNPLNSLCCMKSVWILESGAWMKTCSEVMSKDIETELDW